MTEGTTPEDRRAVDALFSRTYEELRRLAAAIRRDDARATINPTALVNEAWLKLSAAPPADSLSPLHFKRVAARAMRQVLVEAARRRSADKRGGGALALSLSLAGDSPASDHDPAAAPLAPTRADELLALDQALTTLARMSPRQAAVVESRWFGGLEAAETAELLGVSEATVVRDWRAARAWLSKELRDP